MAIYEGNCKHCGNAFRRIRAKTQQPPKYCSRACFRAAECLPHVIKECEFCGKQFDVIGSIAERSRFCSYDCYWRSGQPAKNSPFVEGRTGGRKTRGKVYVGRVDGKPRYIQRSHAVWNEHHPDDPVGPNDHVHHRDGDWRNDDISNLEKLTSHAHLQLHAAELSSEQRSYWAKERHRRNPGKQRKGTPKQCAVCGSEFYRPPSASQVTCSYRCSGIWSARLRKERSEQRE